MANPQKELGHLDIANEIVDHLASANITGTQYKLLWTIWRKTWGWHKKTDKISLLQFQEATNLHQRSIMRGLKQLRQKNIITYTTQKGKTTQYQFQKDYTKWDNQSQISIPTSRQMANSSTSRNSVTNFTQSSPLTSRNSVTNFTPFGVIQKKYPKEKKKLSKESEIENDFLEFWEKYSRKENKKEAKAVFDQLRRQGITQDQIMTITQKYIYLCNKENRQERFIKCPNRFLESANFEQTVSLPDPEINQTKTKPIPKEPAPAPDERFKMPPDFIKQVTQNLATKVTERSKK